VTQDFRRWAEARLPDWFRLHILAHDMGLGHFLLRAGAERDAAGASTSGVGAAQ
jgi:hypothetical protein